jgi:hypothetical protein
MRAALIGHSYHDIIAAVVAAYDCNSERLFTSFISIIHIMRVSIDGVIFGTIANPRIILPSQSRRHRE